MFDLRGWTPPVDAGPFRFRDRDPSRPLAHLSDGELQAQTLDLLPRAVESWRSGPDRDRAARLLRRVAGLGSPPELLERYPAALEAREYLGALLTPEELLELEGAR